MTLEPLLNAGPAVQIHTASALAAFFLGAIMLWRQKGTGPHKRMGRVWVMLMLVTAISSFFIHEIKVWGNFSPIHLLSVFVLVSLASALYLIRKGDVRAHGNTMQGLFIGGLVLAGALTFLPGRIFYRILFG